MESTHRVDGLDVELLHEIGSRAAAAAPMRDVLARVVDFAVTLVKCDSCFVYVREGDQLILRASKNKHDDVLGSIRMRVGQGITGWVAERGQIVAIPRQASNDFRFQVFNELEEDQYEAFLSVPVMCRNKVVGVINLQHREAHLHTKREISLVSMIGFFVGAELELARLESENLELTSQIETRDLMSRAKSMLQYEHGMTDESAFLALQRYGRVSRMSMKDVAQAVIDRPEVRKAIRA